jgi:uncharacterized protein
MKLINRTNILLILFLMMLFSVSISCKKQIDPQNRVKPTSNGKKDNNAFPIPTGWVNDYAGLLSESTIADLTKLITELKKTTDVEMAIATFPNLGGRDYREFTTALYNSWGVGNKKNEGILIMIAVQERKIKFEVGSGAEKYLNEYTEEVYQNFKKDMTKNKDNYNVAVINATKMILAKIAQEKGVTIKGIPTLSATK